MTVSPISGAGATPPATGEMHRLRAKVLSAVAQTLNLSVDHLRSQLGSGQSLADIAKVNGMTAADLKSTITSALQSANLPAGTDLGALADRIAQQVSGPHRRDADGDNDGSRAPAVPGTQLPVPALTFSAAPRASFDQSL